MMSRGVCVWHCVFGCVCLRRLWPALHTFLLCLHNCFLGAAWLSRAPGPPGEVLPADRQLGPAGDMPGPAEPLKSAGWLWTVAAGGGNQSVSIPPPSLYLFLSLYLCLSLPLQPPAQSVSAAIESFMFTGRKAKETQRRNRGGNVTHLQKEFIWFLRIKGMKAEKLTKPAPVVMIILY